MANVMTKPQGDFSDLCRKFNSTICSTDFAAIDHVRSVSAHFDGVQLGPVNVYKYAGRGVRGATRNIQHVRTNPVDEFLIFVPLSGSISLLQGNRRCAVGRGGFGFLSSLRTYEVYCGHSPDHEYSEFFIKVPGAMLRNQVPLVDEYCAIAMRAGEGSARVLSVLVEAILADGNRFNEAQARIFSSMLIDAIAITVLSAPEANAQHELLGLSPSARLRLKATDFIKANLSNSRLDAPMIARGCNVSLRLLHEAFISSTTTVGALVREMRMVHCRNDLRNPAMRGQTAIQIAMRWGFSSSTSFTRAYRAHFGRTPSDERRVRHFDKSIDEGRFVGSMLMHGDGVVIA